MENKPKVTVCVVTYNQEKYIAECLQSLVDQKADFKFEIVVSDDCSTDNTRKIISDFYERYPGLFRVFLHEKNMGALKNFKFVHGQAAGKYVAHMDGDDYALPGKLQAQADFLDENPDCNIVFHRMNIIENGEYIETNRMPLELVNKKFNQQDVIEYGAVGANSSRMYRSSLRSIPLPDFDFVDYTLYVLHADKGYVAYCNNEALGVYRKGVGISGSDKVYVAYYDSLKYFLENIPGCNRSVSVLSLGLFLGLLKKMNFKVSFLFLRLFLENICLDSLSRYLYLRNIYRR